MWDNAALHMLMVGNGPALVGLVAVSGGIVSLAAVRPFDQLAK